MPRPPAALTGALGAALLLGPAALGGACSPPASRTTRPAAPPHDGLHAAAADTVDVWHVYLDAALVYTGPQPYPDRRLTLATLRRADSLHVVYATDTDAGCGATITAYALGRGTRRVTSPRTCGAASFATPTLLHGLRPGERLAFRIDRGDAPARYFLEIE